MDEGRSREEFRDRSITGMRQLSDKFGVVMFTFTLVSDYGKKRKLPQKYGISALLLKKMYSVELI